MPRLGRQREPVVTPPPHKGPEPVPNSLVASAARIKLDSAGWNAYRFGDDSWQSEAWRLYDTVGELRFAANWIGSCCSRVRIYVAEVDKNGRVQQEVDADKQPKIAALADTLFGGPTSKAEALRMLGINLTVVGDAYIVGKGGDDASADQWYVVSCSEIKRMGRGESMYYGFIDDRGRLLPGPENRLNPDSDIIIRVWTPHPRRNLWADSPTRGAMPMLWEIERLTKFVFAQIDSRLVSAGIAWIPKEASFPTIDGDMTGAEALTDILVKAAALSRKGEDTAAGVVPMFVELPTEALGKVQLTQFTSELSQQARELREEALSRFATAMDMPPEILKGTGDTNHWSSWHVEESAVKVHIEPLMSRLCDALTTAYLKAALKSIGKDPDRYIFWYDTAPLTVRPQKLQDTHNLYKDGIVGKQTVILAGDYKLSDLPTDEEDLQRFTRELMLRDPNLMQIPAIRKIAGYTDELLPPETVVTPPGAPGAGPPPPPAPPTGIQQTTPPPLPQGSTAEGAPAEIAPPVVASTSVPKWASVFVVADAAVLRALELAGKRMLDARTRNQFPDTPPYELHTRIPVRGADRVPRLLHGAWDHLSALSGHLDLSIDTNALQNVLDGYCTELLLSGRPHQTHLLGERLRERSLVQ